MTARTVLLLGLAALGLTLSACSSHGYSRSDRAILGGAAGVGIGAATGNVGGALAGGAIGAAIGAATY